MLVFSKNKYKELQGSTVTTRFTTVSSLGINQSVLVVCHVKFLPIWKKQYVNTVVVASDDLTVEAMAVYDVVVFDIGCRDEYTTNHHNPVVFVLPIWEGFPLTLKLPLNSSRLMSTPRKAVYIMPKQQTTNGDACGVCFNRNKTWKTSCCKQVYCQQCFSSWQASCPFCRATKVKLCWVMVPVYGEMIFTSTVHDGTTFISHVDTELLVQDFSHVRRAFFEDVSVMGKFESIMDLFPTETELYVFHNNKWAC